MFRILLCLLLLIQSAPQNLRIGGKVAIAYVNGNYGTADARSTTLAAGAINATAGNTIVVICYHYDAGVPSTAVSSIADTAGNDAKYGICGAYYAPDTSQRIEIWKADNITGNAANVVTVTWAGTGVLYRRIVVLQYSGMDSTGSYDSTYDTSNSDASSPYTSSGDTTTVDGEMIVAAFVNVDTATFTSSSPSVVRNQVPGDVGSGENLIASAGANKTVAVASTTTTTVYILAKGFKPAAGGATALSYSTVGDTVGAVISEGVSALRPMFAIIGDDINV